MANHTTVSPNSELTGEPALWLGLASGVLQLAAAFVLPWSDETLAIVNAALAAAFGVWVAFTTKSADQGGAIKGAIIGLAQALINVALVFGWDASIKQTAAVMSVVTLACAVFIRQTSSPTGERSALHTDKNLNEV